MVDLDGFLMHSITDFEEWSMDNGYDVTFALERDAAMERFAHEHNYTVDELEDAGW